MAAPVEHNGYTLSELSVFFPSMPNFGSLLAIPDVVDPGKPIIIAIHGHELIERGHTPWTLFASGSWAEVFAQAGYVVWAPSHLWYSEFTQFYDSGHDYHFVWVRMLSRMLDAASINFPAHAGMVATGLSSGAVSASFLAAYRNDIDTGVFAGSLIGLDFLRENYRYLGHPDNWDVRGFFDYAPIYALIAPRPAQWQMGRQDAFFPRTVPVAGSGPFPGLPRPVSVQTFLGEWFLLERIWDNMEGQAALHIHDGGHIFDPLAAIFFIENHFLP